MAFYQLKKMNNTKPYSTKKDSKEDITTILPLSLYLVSQTLMLEQ